MIHDPRGKVVLPDNSTTADEWYQHFRRTNVTITQPKLVSMFQRFPHDARDGFRATHPLFIHPHLSVDVKVTFLSTSTSLAYSLYTLNVHVIYLFPNHVTLLALSSSNRNKMIVIGCGHYDSVYLAQRWWWHTYHEKRPREGKKDSFSSRVCNGAHPAAISRFSLRWANWKYFPSHAT